MIYTLTLNPAIDLELSVDQLVFDNVLRANDCREDTGGKGLNVSRMLKALNGDSIAMGFIGGFTGEKLKKGLKLQGIRTMFTPVQGETRTNISIVQGDYGRHIKVNQSGPNISGIELDLLRQFVEENLHANDWWVLAGSLPEGIGSGFYAELTNQIQRAGAKVILDTSGDALLSACAARPYLIKPNIDEARQILNEPEDGNSNANDLAQKLLNTGIPHVVMSLGKEGALVATQEQITLVQSPEIIEQNPIGAGDSLVGGLVWGLSQNLTLLQAVQAGIACGAATASQPGTNLGTKSQVEDLLMQMDANGTLECLQKMHA